MSQGEVIQSLRQAMTESLQSKTKTQAPSKEDFPQRANIDPKKENDFDEKPTELHRIFPSLSSQCFVSDMDTSGVEPCNTAAPRPKRNTDVKKSRVLQEIDEETLECLDAVQRDIVTVNTRLQRESILAGGIMTESFRLEHFEPALPLMRLCCACNDTVPDSRLARFMLSRPVGHAISFLILANTVFIGYETSISMSEALTQKSAASVGDPVFNQALPSVAERAINLCFTTAFALELVLKLLAFPGHFFVGDDWKWNLFDMFLVCTSIVHELFENYNVGFMRAIRIFRVVRISRILRVLQIFRELRVMVLAIGSSLKSLGWTFALLLLIMYTFSLLLMKGAQAFIEENDRNSDDFQVAQYHFGSLWKTMMCLLQIISGGEDWSPVYQIMNKQSPIYGLILLVYVVFVVFGVLNVLTGVFVCDSVAIRDFDLICHSEAQQRRQFVEEMKRMFEDLDEDNSGCISWEEFDGRMHDQALQAYFASHDLDPFNVRLLFKMLDDNKSAQIDIMDFIVGCYKLKGSAKSMQVKKIERDMRRYHEEIHERFQKLEQHMQADSHNILSAYSRIQQQLPKLYKL